MINGRWHLRLGRFPLLEKQSEELSYPFRSVQCTLVDGLKSFFIAYMGVILSFESSVNVVLFLCEFKIRNEVEFLALNYFCTGFSVGQIASLQATGFGFVTVTVFTTSSVFYIPMIAILLVVESLCGHSNFFLLLNATLQAWPSKVFVIVFKIIPFTGRSTSSCFQYISLVGRFAVSYFVTLLPFNIISVIDDLAPSCYLIELFSRLIAPLRVVLFRALKTQNKTSMGENCFV